MASGSRLDGAIQAAPSSNSMMMIDGLMAANSGKGHENTRSTSNGTREREQPKDRTAKRRGSEDDALEFPVHRPFMTIRHLLRD